MRNTILNIIGLQKAVSAALNVCILQGSGHKSTHVYALE